MRCRLGVAEDVNHVFWECLKVHLVWNWIRFMLQLMTTQPEDAVQLTMSHALIGEPLEDAVSVPKAWWALLRAAAIWFIWICT